MIERIFKRILFYSGFALNGFCFLVSILPTNKYALIDPNTITPGDADTIFVVKLFSYIFYALSALLFWVAGSISVKMERVITRSTLLLLVLLHFMARFAG
ncbi:hypothetical protein [Zooshikella sp. RANM57]|uniref:hypothetical protein n=1 Tax=Zooshikella sp. RANM57 TaxID=3425863 RepID=UPI003D6E3105